MKKKSSRDWAKEQGIGGICCFGETDPVKNPKLRVLDPDGWDRRNWEKDIEKKITLQEFNRRIMFSTIMGYDD